MSTQRPRSRGATRTSTARRPHVGSQPTRTGANQAVLDFRQSTGGSNRQQQAPFHEFQQLEQVVFPSLPHVPGLNLPTLPTLTMLPSHLGQVHVGRASHASAALGSAPNVENARTNSVPPVANVINLDHHYAPPAPDVINLDLDDRPLFQNHTVGEVVTISETESIYSADDNSNSDIQEISDSEPGELAPPHSSQGGAVSSPWASQRAVRHGSTRELAVNEAGAESQRSNPDRSHQMVSQVDTQVAPSLPPQPHVIVGSDDETDDGRSSEEEPMETDQADRTQPEPDAAPVVPDPIPVTPNPLRISAPSANLTSSQSAFRTPKKVGASAAAAKVMSPEKSDDEGESCPICFESWTTSGAHRLVSLKCGHLFGQSCIDKWLRGQGEKCPHCNRKAKRSDIRVIYAKALKVVDTTEKDQALVALEKEKEARKRAEYEAADSRLRFQLVVEENNKLKQELERKKQQIENLSSCVPSTTNSTLNQANKQSWLQNGSKYLLDRNVEISKAGGCRVMTCSLRLGAIIISQPSANPMFPGFGVKKLSTNDFRTAQFVHIHSKMIRDLAFNPKSHDGLLLSCGIDKMLKITSVISNTVVQSYEAPMPIWSCCWNSDSGHIVYAGLLNGKVLAFDTRKTDEVLDTINSQGSNKPVVALQYVPRDEQASFKPSGLLVGQMDRTSFFEELPDHQHKVHMLPLEGTLTSLSFESNTRHILATFRPSAKTPSVRHTVCELALHHEPTNVHTQNLCTCHTVQTLHGGSTMKMLSRSQLYCNPDHQEKLLVCAGDEATLSTKVWDASEGHLRQKLTSNGPVVDTCQFNYNENHYLTTLTEKSLAVYKWT
ncbi:E3 ubiquitin-protein ligase rfwd3.L-like isoform X2 [Lineus longissimus]|uniref:E3 ubiquitin-protein ligase rfwd3.L-like isoform X2 n=1 Tax=Lineus longissimus TaxID=88925 RepID=UPI00315C81FD